MFGSSETTSTSSSDEVVLRANKLLRLLNEFVSECDVKRVDNPQFEWLKSADRTKRRYIQHTQRYPHRSVEGGVP